jgi:hypothetical protein
MRIESKVRIEEFKKQEEKKLQELITHARLEKDTLWSRMVQSSTVTSNEPPEEKVLDINDSDFENNQTKKKSTHHNDHRVRFAGQEEPSSIKRIGFVLDESAISNLRHVDLDQNKLQNKDQDDDLDQGNLLYGLHLLCLLKHLIN